jgi:type II secretory pathway component GspD/PulD (secretin)
MNIRRALALASLVLLVPNVGAGTAAAQEQRVFLNSSVDLGTAIDAINRQSRTKIVLHHSVPANTPLEMRLDGVPFGDAIADIAQSEDLLAHREANLVMLGPCADFLRLYNAMPPIAYHDHDAVNPGSFTYAPDAQGVLSMEPRRIYFDLTSGDVDDIAAKMKAELPSCSLITADHRLGRIVVAGSRSTVARAIALYQVVGSAFPDFDTIPILNQPASDVVLHIKGQLPDNTLLADDNSRNILVSGPPVIRARARSLIAAVDVKTPEAWYDIRVVDYQPQQDSTNVGFQWGGKDLSGAISVGSTSTGFSSFSLPVNVTVNDVITNTHSTILASTMLRAPNGKTEQWNVVDVKSYGVTDLRTGSVQRQDVSAGLKLTVKSAIYSDKRVLANLQLEYSDFIPSTNEFPDRTVRQIIMDPDLADGETAVMSGLMRDLDATTISKVPGLSNLPILGGFFRNKQKTRNHEQIVVFITPHLVLGRGQAIPMNTIPAEAKALP